MTCTLKIDKHLQYSMSVQLWSNYSPTNLSCSLWSRILQILAYQNDAFPSLSQRRILPSPICQFRNENRTLWHCSSCGFYKLCLRKHPPIAGPIQWRLARCFRWKIARWRPSWDTNQGNHLHCESLHHWVPCESLLFFLVQLAPTCRGSH